MARPAQDPPPPQAPPPPGWYPDPDQVDTQRYWDGSRWTDQRAPAAQPGSGSNGFAVTALVCGILGVVFGLITVTYFIAWILGAIALIFGILGRRDANKRGVGKGMSIAGVVLALLALALGTVGYNTLSNQAEEIEEAFEEFEFGGPN